MTLRFLAVTAAAAFLVATGCASTPSAPPIPERSFADLASDPGRAVLIMRSPPNRPQLTIARQYHRVDTATQTFLERDGNPRLGNLERLSISRTTGISTVLSPHYIAVTIPPGDYVVVSETEWMTGRGSQILSSTVTCFAEGAPLYRIEAGSLNILRLPFSSIFARLDQSAPPSTDRILELVHARIGANQLPINELSPIAQVAFNGNRSLFTSRINCPESDNYTLIED